MKRRGFFKCLASLIGVAALAPFQKLLSKPSPKIELTGPLPSCYPQTPQDFAQEIVDAIEAPHSLDGVNIGKSVPSNKDIPWIRLNADGSYDNCYNFDESKNFWVSAPNIFTGEQTVIQRYVEMTEKEAWETLGGKS